MTSYIPNNWVVIKVNLIDGEPLYKVLAGWSGSYMEGSSWQLNSGIVKVEDDGDYYLFHGNSGSIYKCHKDQYCLRTSTIGIWNMMQEKYPGQLEMMDENTDWFKLIEVK